MTQRMVLIGDRYDHNAGDQWPAICALLLRLINRAVDSGRISEPCYVDLQRRLITAGDSLVELDCDDCRMIHSLLQLWLEHHCEGFELPLQHSTIRLSDTDICLLARFFGASDAVEFEKEK